MNRNERLTSSGGSDFTGRHLENPVDNMENTGAPVIETETLADEPSHVGRPPLSAPRRRRLVGAGIIGTLLLGGVAAAALFGPLSVLAADPSTAPSATSQAGTANAACVGGGPGGRLGGRNEAVSDASVVAKVIGISESDLTTALQGGQSMAAVATAHNVDVQKVLDVLVTDKLDELAAAVSSGTITQAQADAEKANVTQQITDQVNGTHAGRPDGHGGPGGAGRPGAGAPNGQTAPNATSAPSTSS